MPDAKMKFSDAARFFLVAVVVMVALRPASGQVCCKDTCSDPCAEDNGGCEHICTPTEEGDDVTCSCNDDYRLDGNGFNCSMVRSVSLVTTFLDECLPGGDEDANDEDGCQPDPDDIQSESDLRRDKNPMCFDDPPAGKAVDDTTGTSPDAAAAAAAADTCPQGSQLRAYYDLENDKCMAICINDADSSKTLNLFQTMFNCQWLCEDPCNQTVETGNCEELKRQGGTVPAPVKRYYYDNATRTCKAFTYTGCELNKNNFESLAECANVCPVPLLVSVNGTTVPVDSTDIAAQIYTEDGNIRLYLDAVFPNPSGQGDLVVTETMDIAARTKRQAVAANGATLQRADGTPIEGVAVNLAEASFDQISSDRTEFCESVDREIPELRQNVFDADSAMTVEEENVAVANITDSLQAEITALLEREDQEYGVLSREKRQFDFFGKRPRNIKWATVYRQRKCKTFRINIRVWCIRALINRPPSRAEFRRLCGLFKAGIERHWSRDIHYKGSTWKVEVKVKESLVLSKKVIIKYYETAPNNPASFNADLLPIVMKYLKYQTASPGADIRFMVTSAHELGHSVLMNTFGLIYSWTHKGTSTWTGNHVAATPSIPATGELDLMKYYVGDEDTEYMRIFATEEDVRGLINEARFYFPVWWCFGDIGAPCFKNSQCNSGYCHWLRCVECKKDSHCPAGQYCYGKNNPLIVNDCRNKKPNGAWCLRDAECQSNRCDGARCVECEQDSHCPPWEYCANKNLPFILNKCKGKKSLGSLCSRDSMCQSGHCDGGRCGECEVNSDCPAGQYCKYNNLPLVVNRCRSKKSNGEWCTKDSQCASGYCDGNRCAECEEDYHCPSHQYCKYKNVWGVVNDCRNKLCTGWCSRDAMCKSGKCRFPWFRCKKC